MKYVDESEERTVEAWLEQAVEQLCASVEPEAVILFGSWARGRATRHSDLDLCIIWDTSLSPVERIGRILEELPRSPRPVEPVVYTPVEWEEVRSTNAFARRIEEEGRILYERGEVVE